MLKVSWYFMAFASCARKYPNPLLQNTSVMKKQATSRQSVSADLYDQPGHLMRRAHQITVSMFQEEVGDVVSPKEFAILRMIHETPDVDQVRLARLIGIDTSSAALTSAKLEKRGLIARTVSTVDRRLLSLRLTAEGEKLLDDTVNGVYRMREKLLSPLTAAEQKVFMKLLQKFVHLHNDESRAPLWTQVDAAQPAKRQENSLAKRLK
jgi:DNA-binding MarR family transcriptional regulator